jgi:hypothetical protein
MGSRQRPSRRGPARPSTGCEDQAPSLRDRYPSAPRPRRRVIDPEQLHVRDFGERRQRCILVTRASHLGLVMSAFDADHGNAPCVSPRRIMRYAIFLPRKHFRLRNRNEMGAPTSSGELVELHPEATPGIRSAQFANVEAGQIQASPSSGSGPTSSCAPSPSALTKT